MKSGFTLIEVLVTTGIVIVAGILLAGIVVNTTGISLQQSSKVDLGIEANDALSKIRQGVKEALSIASTYPEVNPVYTSSPTQLILKLNSIDGVGNIIADNYDYFVYFSSSNKLYFKSFPTAQSVRKAQNQILTTDLDTLVFEYFSNSNPPQAVAPNLAARIRTTLSFKAKAGLSNEIYIATSEATLRND